MMEWNPMTDHIYASHWMDEWSEDLNDYTDLFRIVAHSGKHSMWHKIWSTHIEWQDGTLTDGNYDLTQEEALQDARLREREVLETGLGYQQQLRKRN